jgi:hypothetical protein
LKVVRHFQPYKLAPETQEVQVWAFPIHVAQGDSHLTQLTVVSTGEDYIVYPDSHDKQFTLVLQVLQPSGHVTQLS